MDHDRLFKELLTTFFAEFIELFFPEVSAYLDRASITFLDKEVFTDVTSGERHEVDVVARARFRGEETFFLVHVETQSTPDSRFAQRMFRYFARLHEQHGLPVYPIALFSYDAPQRPEPDRYDVRFPDLDVLAFRFRVVQLNRLNWRDFVRQQNPVASALMAKMRIAPADRPRVKLECLRLMTKLKLDPARMQMIAGFVASYLRLTAAEANVYRAEVASDPASAELEKVMYIETDWGQNAYRRLLSRMFKKKFGEYPPDVEEGLQRMTEPQMEDLADASLDFTRIDEVRDWLAQH